MLFDWIESIEFALATGTRSEFAAAVAQLAQKYATQGTTSSTTSMKNSDLFDGTNSGGETALLALLQQTYQESNDPGLNSTNRKYASSNSSISSSEISFQTSSDSDSDSEKTSRNCAGSDDNHGCDSSSGSVECGTEAGAIEKATSAEAEFETEEEWQTRVGLCSHPILSEPMNGAGSTSDPEVTLKPDVVSRCELLNQ